MPVAPVGPRAASTESAALQAIVSRRSSRRRAVPRDRRLDQVPDAVQLVAELEILVLAAGCHDLDERVQVAVVALRGRDRLDRLVRHPRDVRVRGAAELPGDALEPLVDVRVEERERPVEHDPDGPVVAARARGEAHVHEIAGLDELVEHVRQRPLAVHAQAVGPEPAGDRHVLAAERVETADGGRRRQDRRGGLRDPGPVADGHAHARRSTNHAWRGRSPVFTAAVLQWTSRIRTRAYDCMRGSCTQLDARAACAPASRSVACAALT